MSIIMISKFVGRKEDLEALNSFYEENRFQNIVVYGRRRIGKTELCLQFLKNKKGLYFLSRKEPIAVQAQRLVRKFCEQEGLFPVEINSFEDAFSFIANKIKGKQYVVVLDEFPYLIEENASIPSYFQYIIDEILKKTKVYLILLGSSISIMENQVLGYKSALYGRRTGQLEVKPLRIHEIKGFFPNKSFEEIIQIYGVLDGIPAYLQQFSAHTNIHKNIGEYMLRKEKYLFEEVDFLLNQELREPKKYKLILQAVAQGINRLSSIANETNISVNVLTTYMSTLIDLHILKKEYSLTEQKGLSRNVIYSFEDNYFKFYFLFIYPRKDLIEEGKSKVVLDHIKKEFTQYLSFVFEEVCQKAVRRTGKYMKVGKIWRKELEIDVAAYNDDELLLGECKYRKVDGQRVLRKLMDKKITIDKQIEYRVFAKEYTKKTKECLDLKDIERMLRL